MQFIVTMQDYIILQNLNQNPTLISSFFNYSKQVLLYGHANNRLESTYFISECQRTGILFDKDVQNALSLYRLLSAHTENPHIDGLLLIFENQGLEGFETTKPLNLKFPSLPSHEAISLKNFTELHLVLRELASCYLRSSDYHDLNRATLCYNAYSLMGRNQKLSSQICPILPNFGLRSLTSDENIHSPVVHQTPSSVYLGKRARPHI